MSKKTLIVGGTFDDQGGKKSGYIHKLFYGRFEEAHFLNGGYFSNLESLDFREYEVIIWCADVPNDKSKLIDQIKQINSRCLLISSKNNLESKYKPLEIIARALHTKSNLLIEFQTVTTLSQSLYSDYSVGPKQTNSMIGAKIWDPLGNVYIQSETDPDKVFAALSKRIEVLSQYTRVSSLYAGEAIETPDESEFFQLAKDHAEKFHHLIHAVNQDRFVGNLSFRCQHGFPSFKAGNFIFVSKRNIDKRSIDKSGFIAVDLALEGSYKKLIWYRGEDKPSVDAPIQISLYMTYPNINYMLHSHAYIKDAPFTKNVIPCGALEEVNDIKDVITDWRQDLFAINLRGHGSLVAASTVEQMRNIDYVARELPELQLS